jgi:SAM-dependent methyltransferase
MSRPRYAAAALLDRASALRPVARGRELVRAVRAAEPAGPAPDGLPYPPARLRVLVASGDTDGYFHGGRAAATAIRAALDRAGMAPSNFEDVLDFGCGSGRVARHLKDEPWRLSGCDYNRASVDWCDRHLPFMTASPNDLEPPAPYPAESFDLVYAISVVTHLTDALGRAWIREWSRMLRPGGVLLVSTLGDRRRHLLNARQLELYDNGRPVVTKEHLQGMNVCVAHHPAPYVTGTLLSGLELLAEMPGGTSTGFRQDAYVARVPTS